MFSEGQYQPELSSDVLLLSAASSTTYLFPCGELRFLPSR